MEFMYCKDCNMIDRATYNKNGTEIELHQSSIHNGCKEKFAFNPDYNVYPQPVKNALIKLKNSLIHNENEAPKLEMILSQFEILVFKLSMEWEYEEIKRKSLKIKGN